MSLAALGTATDLRNPKVRHVATDVENNLRPGRDSSSRRGSRLAVAVKLPRSEGSGTKIEAMVMVWVRDGGVCSREMRDLDLLIS